jgi:hypothetical protein
LDLLIIERPADETLNDVDGTLRVNVGLILGGFSYQALLIGEGNEGWSDSISELVWNDLDSSILKDTNAGIGGSQIDTNDRSFD